MRRYFNTEGRCKPDVHYMVNLDERLDKIKKLYIDRGKYFIINRGRQYGKTTTLRALQEYLKNEYTVVSMDFQGLSTEDYKSESSFTKAFMRLFSEVFDKETVDTDLIDEYLNSAPQCTLGEMFRMLSKLCGSASAPVVLMIDEVDSASNNQVFIDFLAQLRMYYLDRENRAIFHSVVLAGVYDIKNLKLKIRSDEEHQYNSPWNIAAKFSVDMSFSPKQIAAMLQEYEADNHTGMDITAVSNNIYDYTSGYPYLVSALCKIMDEELPEKAAFVHPADIWTQSGIVSAVQILLKEKTPLFDSLVKQFDIYKDLRHILEEIIYCGKKFPFSLDVKSIEIGQMFGFLKEENGQVTVANRIFEMRLLNMFITEEAVTSEIYQNGERDMNQFIQNNRLDMDCVLEKFTEHFTEIYGDNDEKFAESYGRRLFLLYLKPIINGTGNYYIEAQTRDAGRTDIVVDYLGEQFIVELKIWRGNEYNARGEKQLIEYLEYFHLEKGYLLSFNFNKKKETGMKTLRIGNKTIVEAVV